MYNAWKWRLSDQRFLCQQTETHTQSDVSWVSECVCVCVCVCLMNTKQRVEWPFGSLCGEWVTLPCCDNEDAIQSTRQEKRSPAYQGSKLVFIQIFDNIRQCTLNILCVLCENNNGRTEKMIPPLESIKIISGPPSLVRSGHNEIRGAFKF